MAIIRTATFRTFHQSGVVTLSLRQNDANFIVRCHPHGFPLISKYETVCASREAAERLYTQKFTMGMVGG